MDVQRIIVAITGATGAIYGVRLLEALQACPGVETHLILSSWAEKTIALETNRTVESVREMAHCCHDLRNVGAPIASGSFQTSGMAVIPCSMKTLAAIAHGLAENLIIRAADVMLKERKKLILVPRETPLSGIHLENMLAVNRAGAYLVPPMPAFYNHPASIGDLVNHLVGRVMDQFSLPHNLTRRWGEDGSNQP
ncbi:MAG: putative aromatic acid decarboxylase [Pelotomaculum sp. PtaB.Bin013]|uniref:Flavin prenyltransferase UbiX n=1 Tax=Pelotomaculum isophthalicicum JI TaxID=947010 RepID=A0A9X4H793_9FIRM|nr:UbiX family flavin prenyltransferase [Pelotomaculum isophthalicicum]MDF9409878.1 UbiX family flavin prenyltransferase [Pelotomaculum isophthalicicum JI]OPX82774.1 MAG: putative aromatic acid decarboxylase [Pelotomaculum sp. PtaB.Bin013]